MTTLPNTSSTSIRQWTGFSEARKAARASRDRRDGLRISTHVSGRCGMDVGANCSECLRDDLNELEAFLADAELPPVEPTDDFCSYYTKLNKLFGVPFVDAWVDASRFAMKQRREHEEWDSMHGRR